MLPYPSGDIHVGHVRNYCITDVVARYKRMRGFNVLHPIGWDALGLPAENAAIKRGVHPEKWTRDNIAGMKRQLQRLGFSYPWSREIATCDPEYYRWNQWFFLRMLERDIAYRAKAAVNWCPSCQTVLANEQAEGGECWRCHSKVEERELDQWFLRITAYQDELLDDMAQLPAWPERVLRAAAQLGGPLARGRGGLPRSRAADALRVFTTRIDTIYGATFMVLAPEHPRVDGLVAGTPTRRRRARARAPAGAGPARAPGRPGGEGRRVHGPPRGEPVQRRAHPDLGRQLRADGLRHRARSCRCPRTTSATSSSRASTACRSAPVIQPAGGALGRTCHHREPTRARSRRRTAARSTASRSSEALVRMAAHARGEGLRQARRHATACATGSSAASATGARPSPSSTARRTAWCGVPDAQLPVVLPAGRALHGRGRQPAREGAGVREHDLPALRRPGAARDGHHGHVRGLVLVLLPLPLAPQGRRPLRHRRRCATGSRSTSTWAASSTPSCTSCTRASGPR